jgi:hypothetical protein
MEALRQDDPRRFGPYTALARFRESASAVHYLTRSVDGGDLVVVTAARPGLASVPAFRRRFRAEAATAERLAGGWVQPPLTSPGDGGLWTATPYVPAVTLAEAIGLAGPLAAVHRGSARRQRPGAHAERWRKDTARRGRLAGDRVRRGGRAPAVEVPGHRRTGSEGCHGRCALPGAARREDRRGPAGTGLLRVPRGVTRPGVRRPGYAPGGTPGGPCIARGRVTGWTRSDHLWGCPINRHHP